MLAPSSHFNVWPDSPELADVLKAIACLSGVDSVGQPNESGTNGLADVLRLRLATFDRILHVNVQIRDSDLFLLQLNTAYAALYALEHVQRVLSQHEGSSNASSSADGTPTQIGSKDMGQLRTLLSIVFKWGTELLLSRVLPGLPNKRSPRLPPGAQIIDLTVACEDYTQLSDLLARLLKLLYPEGPQGRALQTFITAQIYSRCFTQILRPCICLGWLPKELRGDFPPLPEVKLYTARLLNSVPPSQSITSLGAVQATSTTLPLYVNRVCSQFLCTQLLRPHGVAGLFSALFGEDVSSEEAPLQKLENVSKVLNVVPSTMTRESYFAKIIPRLVHLLTPDMSGATPPAHKRAAAFSLSRMLINTSETPENDIKRQIVSWVIHDCFHARTESSDKGTVSPPQGSNEAWREAYTYATRSLKLTPLEALHTITTIITNADPTPTLISILLRPILPQLYALREHLGRSKMADPTVRDLVESLLQTWARSSDKEEVVACLWEVVESTGDDWTIDEDGIYRVVQRSTAMPSLTFAQLAELQSGALDPMEGDEDNALGLWPNPNQFVGFLRNINRDEVASEIYLKVLEAHVKLEGQDNPLKKLLFLKLAMQISEQLGETSSRSNPFKKADVKHVLAFVKYALEEASSQSEEVSINGLPLDKLTFVSQEDEDVDGDSDDEDPAPGLEGVERSKYLVVTAMNLLLALLEGNPDLSPRTVPLLNDIYTQLSPLADSTSGEVRARAREARLILTARLHSTIRGGSESRHEDGRKGEEGEEEENPNDKYQRALKLLQDPLLPVRAHGLLLLRELVSPRKANVQTKREKGGKERGSGMGMDASMTQGQEIRPPAAPAALIPAVLSIFLQAVQDEDSYIFLNAVQGLSAMVDGFGRDVLKGLAEEYARGLEGLGGSERTMTLQEVDTRVRVGEALSQVIKRCGGALGSYVDIIVPRVFAVVRASHLPTSLRTSAISLLATAADTNALALNAFAVDLLSAMIDLVQVESVRSAQSSAKGKEAARSSWDKVPTVVRESDVSEGGVHQQAASSRNTGVPPENKANGNNGKRTSPSAHIPASMDAQPTAANSKFPPLRRAALHFLSLLVHSMIARVYEYQGSEDSFSTESALGVDLPDSTMKRGSTVLKYVGSTDIDEVVRVMAREAAELLEQLRRVLLGFPE